MLGPKKKLLYGQNYGIYIEQKTDSNSVCVYFSIYTIYRTVWAFVILYTLRKFHIVFFCPIIIYSTLNGFMTFTFWLFQPYIYRRIYVYNAYMQPCISLNLCEFCTIFWHLKNTVNCVLWISMRVHIFHAIFIYISITKCPLALYIQSVYAHSHSNTRYYTILCGLISIFNYICYFI